MPSRLFLLLLPLSFMGCHEKYSLFSSEQSVQLLFSQGKLTEGPAIDPLGNLYFSDQPNDVIRKITPEGIVEIVLQPSGVANGLAFDREGRLLICQSNHQNFEGDTIAGKRSVARLEKEGNLTLMAGEYEGKPLNGPNDLCVDQQGRIYFTDPYYPSPKVAKTQPVSGVYRIDAPGEVSLLIDNLEKPNGILITPDQTTLYVSDRGTQQLHRYLIRHDGTVSHDAVVYTFSNDRGIDGMCMDVDGNIYAAAGEGKTAGVYVIDPEAGKLLDFKSFPATVFNVCFGGEDGKILYVASGGSIYALHTNLQGLVLPVEL